MIPPIVEKLEKKFWKQLVEWVFKELASHTEKELRDVYEQCQAEDCDDISGVMAVTVAGCAMVLLKDKFGVDIQAETIITE